MSNCSTQIMCYLIIIINVYLVKGIKMKHKYFLLKEYKEYFDSCLNIINSENTYAPKLAQTYCLHSLLRFI